MGVQRIVNMYADFLLTARLLMQVSEAIRERAKRIYDKYGNVMLDVKGMTKAGVERKATCRALFSKLLYLAGSALFCDPVSSPWLHAVLMLLHKPTRWRQLIAPVRT